VPDLTKGRLALSGIVIAGVDPGSTSKARLAGDSAPGSQLSEATEFDPEASPAVRQLRPGMLLNYAFLIYNGDEPKYKIVDQKAGKDTTLVEWTSFSAIRNGTTPNQLEVRIRERKLDFYINGQFVTSIVDIENYQGGRVGLYTSDEHEVAFDDLEISR
jgi:hypothetical protein